MESKEILTVLEEIRDVQRQHFEAYSRACAESMAMQQQDLEFRRAAVEQQKIAVEQQKIAVEAQARHMRLYRRVLLVAAPIVAFFVWTITRF